MSKKNVENENVNVSPEEKEKLERLEFNKAIYIGSMLYAVFGIIFILITIISPPIVASFLFTGMGLVLFASVQSLLVLLKKKLSLLLKIILIILNAPVYFLLSFCY